MVIGTVTGIGKGKTEIEIVTADVIARGRMVVQVAVTVLTTCSLAMVRNCWLL